mgnify:CR=1 FL=1
MSRESDLVGDFGDVHLVVQKKGILAINYDETYDLDSDTAINGADLILLRKHLLNSTL